MNLVKYHDLDLPIFDRRDTPIIVDKFDLQKVSELPDPYFLREIDIESPPGFTLRQALAVADDEFERMTEVFDKFPGKQLEIVDHTWALYRGYSKKIRSHLSSHSRIVPEGFTLAAHVQRIDGKEYDDVWFHPYMNTRLGAYRQTPTRNGFFLRDMKPWQFMRKPYSSGPITLVDIEPRLKRSRI